MASLLQGLAHKTSRSRQTWAGTRRRESGVGPADRWLSGREMRTFYFVINFGAAILVVAGCIICLVASYFEGGSFATLAGLIFLPPAAMFARSEWLAFYRRAEARERRLGWACLGMAGFAAFAVV